MNYKDMDTIDLKLHLLSGSEINVDGLKIKPYTLREIKEYGYKNYMALIQWLLITKDDFIEATTDLENRVLLEQQRKSLTTFDFYMKLGGEDFQRNLLIAISVLFKTEDVRVIDNTIAIDFVKDGLLVYENEGELVLDEEVAENLNEDEIKIIHRDNFDDLVQVIKMQNYLDKVTDSKNKDFNPADENARRIAADLERMRKKVEEKKAKQQSQEETDIDISDIIDAVSSKSNSYNKLNIWDLTLYQLYADYARLELIDSYEFSVKAVMAGAKDVDIKHWSSKLDN